jgi:hypothetical protein
MAVGDEEGGMSSSGIANELISERGRQMREEGKTPDADDLYLNGELERAAASWAYGAGCPERFRPWLVTTHKPNRPPGAFHILDTLRTLYPFSLDTWRPEGKSARRMLVIAGALIIAAIERLDRAEARKTGG